MKAAIQGPQPTLEDRGLPFRSPSRWSGRQALVEQPAVPVEREIIDLP
ncbi:MAG TPA: hypothetical protein VMS64_18040 [Candidatus Methylomirabilis sp.]|nr:hypothetical protein [Candidatus Methylomirabilis sp.]